MQEVAQETVYSPELRVFIRRMSRDLKTQERGNITDSISPEMYAIPSTSNPIHNPIAKRNDFSFPSALPAVTTTVNTAVNSTIPVLLNANTCKSSHSIN